MAKINETRAGVVSGVIAGAMVIALTAMAFLPFDHAPQRPDYAASVSEPSRAGSNNAHFTHFETDTNRRVNPLSP